MGNLYKMPQNQFANNGNEPPFSEGRKSFDDTRARKVKEAIFSPDGIQFISALIISALLAAGGIYYNNYKRTGYAVRCK